MWTRRLSSGLWQTMVIAHRYMGIAIGFLMVMWFISGIVMMYVPFPREAGVERLRFQAPIVWGSCCRFGALSDQTEIIRVQVENHLGAPAVRLRAVGQRDSLLDLSQGSGVVIAPEIARKVAIEAASNIIRRPAPIVAYEQVPFDQFTLGRAQRDRPLHRFRFDDPDKTTVYVSGTAGHVVMWTTATERFWNWLGTIPHFLYFESLRTQQQLWSQTVIWTSLLGTFLTVIGIVLGIGQFKRGRDGGLSPYRGWFYWHHVVGLVFGVLTLTWVFSGLVSMNPWGFLEGRGRGEATLAQGPSPNWGDVKASLELLRTEPSVAGVVNLATAPLGGKLYWMATFGDGSVKRLDAAGQVAPPDETELAQAAARIAGNVGIAEQGMLNDEDEYYYARQRRQFEQVVLPVYRVILNDAEQSRYYLDPGSGALVQRADATGRWRRWLFSGLHRLDFTASMRSRPFRDILMWLTMLGGLALSVTGVYLGIRRIRNDVIMVFRFMRRQGRMSLTLGLKTSKL
jgi:uncharacterized iron-regulated membrane protein